MSSKRTIRVAELFAGVGGFRLGLEAPGLEGSFKTVWSSQWEPPGTERRQFASRCYVRHFGEKGHANEDISVSLDRMKAGEIRLPLIDMVVGGFPCQDYSVAKPLNQAAGIQGKKGVLWWQIHRLLTMLHDRGRPAKYVVLENVDRLIKSPGSQRGRDFAIILASLSDLGYDVEWRVINAAEYGHPQKRRRVFIVARRRTRSNVDGTTRIFRDGVLARAFEVEMRDFGEKGGLSPVDLEGDLFELSQQFGRGVVRSSFENAGFMNERRVWTAKVEPDFNGAVRTLGSALIDEALVPEEYYVSECQLPKWRYLKGKKNESRINKASGVEYAYSEGALPMPDPIDRPARTILTAEGGTAPSRFKHIVLTPSGRLRRLVPEELEALNEFPVGWTADGMSAGQRAFCMGNALVTGLVTSIAHVIRRDHLAGSRAAAMKVSVRSG